jgi:hypothetical protein
MHYQNEIFELNSELKTFEKHRRDVEKKLQHAEKLFIKAKHFISQIDVAIKNHANATAITYTDIADIKQKILNFAEENQLVFETKK